MATVIGLLAGSPTTGLVHTAVPTWRPSSRTRGALPTLRLVTRLRLRPRRRPTWVHAHLSEGGSFLREGAVLAIAKVLGISTAATLHGARFMEFSRSRPQLTRRVLNWCSVVFTLGPHAAARVSALTPEARVRQIVNPVDLRELADARPAELVSSVLFGGEIGRRKGVDRLVHAWPDVRRLHPDATCVLCGPMGDFRVDELPDGMHYLGSVDRGTLLGLLKRTKVACLPSRDEALPMFVLESLALGVPVITTPVGEIDQLGEAQGVTLTDGDPAELAARISELLTDGQRHAEWGRRGAEWARANCSIESVNRSLQSVYRSPGAVS
jgi:glycosyltransferase involved in cell wall biosynthesis